MEIAKTVAALREQVDDWRGAGLSVALTPTMGGLHDGHLSLLGVARERADRVVATIFVNPAQFGEGEDLDAYPRDEAADAAMLGAAGCDLLFAPTVAEMYPAGFATEVRVRGLTQSLCGNRRPGHFDGVALVVTKLLNQARADIAVFGEKDWQQLVTIRRLARDLDIATEIASAPTMREDDGLALSSRNRYLDERQRRIAGHLNRMLALTASRIVAGNPAVIALAAARGRLIELGFDTVDYVEMRDAITLEPLKAWTPGTDARIFGAATVGRTRLIDNMTVG